MFWQSQWRTQTLVLSRWFGACGFLATEHTIADPSIRHEFLQWKSAWQDLPKHLKVSRKYSLAFRSKYTPTRQFLGMFHHLYRVANEGLLKLWLLVFLNLSQYADEKVLRRQALSETEISV